jgi:Putative zinc-finger
VNRSLTEGRRRFFERFGELASGAHCADLQAVLSAASDGEASAEQERLLKRHLTSCGSCRAALRSYRTAPRRVAELLPPGVLLPLAQQGNWWSRVTDAIGVGAGDRAGALAWKLQQGAEAVGAGKAAAVVASTAALAGGAAVQEHRADHHPAARSAAHAERTDRARAAEAVPVPRSEPVAAPAPAAPSGTGAAQAADPDPVPAEEFAPAAAASSTPAQPARVSAGAPGGGGGEFGP